MGRLSGVIMDDIHVITGQTRSGGTANTVNDSTSVRCTVAAIIEDVA